MRKGWTKSSKESPRVQNHGRLTTKMGYNNQTRIPILFYVNLKWTVTSIDVDDEYEIQFENDDSFYVRVSEDKVKNTMS